MEEYNNIYGLWYAYNGWACSHSTDKKVAEYRNKRENIWGNCIYKWGHITKMHRVGDGQSIHKANNNHTDSRMLE